MSGRHQKQVAPTIAIVGSGPSGCYTAQFLRKDLPDAEITIFEALPVPYGLVRYGVAADHQGTKAVAAQFDRMFSRANVTFVGNTRIGVDIDFAAITESFDVVVAATGLTADRELPVPHEAGARVVGAGRILRLLNAFPDAAAPMLAPLTEPLGDELVVVGHGNVAIDVVRLLAKEHRHFRGSDVHDEALRALRPIAPRSVRVIGRSSAENAKFDLAMLRELCALDTVNVAAEGLDADVSSPVADLLRAAAHRPTRVARATTVTFHFQTVPRSVRVQSGRTVFHVTDPAGAAASYPADTLITAIGFCHNNISARDPWTAPHVYRVGWFERGARGNIAENRKHAQRTAKDIVADLQSGRTKYGRSPGLAAVRDVLQHSVVDFSGWQAIDATERRAADDERCRRKITSLDDMVSIAAVNHCVRPHAGR
ncbi:MULTISPECIES: FAD-dependent oxidoreductase [unclassified Mycolicibacterium]|uniref:FAD-dependent oxidoreductase n=1 Tax=unclassified Mycolicibacterium TaxID=2636767 RepID=UPI002ED7DA42